MTNEIISFKKKRTKLPKKSLNITVVADRLKNIENAILRKSNLFDLLGQSEQVDFMIYMLERFLENSDVVDLESIETTVKNKLAENSQ